MVKLKSLLARMIEQAKGTQWSMAGTERTGEYVVIAMSNIGRVGFRVVGNYVRVRIEPYSVSGEERLGKMFTEASGWKQPDSHWQYRFSNVFTDPEEAIAAIEIAIKEIGRTDKLQRQPGTRRWRLALRQAVKSNQASMPASAIPAT